MTGHPTRSTQEKHNRKAERESPTPACELRPGRRSCAGVSRRHSDTPPCAPSSLLFVGSASLRNSLNAQSLDSSIGVCSPSSWHTGHWISKLGENFSPHEFLPAAGLHRQYQVPAPPSSVCQGCCLLWIVRSHCHRSLKLGNKAWESTDFLSPSFSQYLLERQTQFLAPQGSLFAWTCFFCPLR